KRRYSRYIRGASYQKESGINSIHERRLSFFDGEAQTSSRVPSAHNRWMEFLQWFRVRDTVFQMHVAPVEGNSFLLPEAFESLYPLAGNRVALDMGDVFRPQVHLAPTRPGTSQRRR